MLWMVIVVLALFGSPADSLQAVYPPANRDGSDSRTDLHVAVIMAFGFDNSFNSSGTVPAIQIALDLINNQSDVLPGYKLNYVLMDSRCNRTVALDVLFKQLISDIPKVGIIGAGCSVATEPTAEISHYYNLTQVSCASSSHKLADRVKYTDYFQMLPSAVNLVPAIVSVCQMYNWAHVAIIGQEENLFGETINRLTEMFAKVNITWNLKTFGTANGPLSLQPDLFDQRSRIFFLAMYSGNARTIICEAYKAGLKYPRYTFIIYGWYSPNWWMPTATFDCTLSNMESVLQYSIAVLQHQFGSNDTAPTETGKSFSEFSDVYQQRLSQFSYRFSPHSIQCFDGVWAFVLALNKTITELANNKTLNKLALEAEGYNSSELFRIENATYKNNIIQKLMFKHLSNTNFLGISGNVTFTSLGIRTVNTLRVFQYRYINNSEEFRAQLIGSVIASNMSFRYLSNESDFTVWNSGVAPYDGTPDNETVSVAIPVTVVFSVLSLGGIGFAIACLIFISVFRKRKFIKLTSPALNYIIIIGAILMYISAILYVFPVYDELGYTIICNLQPRIFSLSYSLCFGTILAKMWRVYYIFTNPKPTRKAIKDWHLAIFVCIVVCIDVVLIGVLTAYQGGRTEAKYVRRIDHPTEERGEQGYIIDYYTYVCESRDRLIWLGIVFGYKAIIQVAALFLAFGIRKVKVKGLNDSKFIGLAVYIISIILTAQIVVFITLSIYVTTFAAIFGACIFITATVILSLTFIPQMVGLYKDPTGEKVFTNMDPTVTKTGTMNFDDMNLSDNIFDDAMMTDQQKIAALTQKVKQMEKENKELKSNTVTVKST